MATDGKPDYRLLLKNSLVKIENLQSRVDAYEQSDREPIAIVGMGCRFPGGSDSTELLWEILQQGIDTISEVSPDRWDIDAYYDPDPQAPGKLNCRAGGFLDLETIKGFDAQFFGIAPREVMALDPQHRLLLEVCWEALEQGNIPPDSLFNSLSGVFMGMGTADYRADNLHGVEHSEYAAYLGTGNAFSTASGRLSYFLGLTGPNLVVDTACSSSLVAVHLACQSLRRKECHLALAGGVNLLLSPMNTIVFSKAGMLAPDGRCKTFDASADGYVRGEGCGVIVLKRLSDAQQAGDIILALIRGSAINQDGRSGGLTVPNGPSQEAVLLQALSNGGVKPGQVDYIEAHGTGTSLGDPIEVDALEGVYGSTHSRSSNPLKLGSVKTNMGHLEAAAGIAGLIKIVLQLQHEEIVPHLHFRQPNPHINWETAPVQVPTENIPWPRGEKPRIAGVSSFGFSGTNAHVILEEAPISPLMDGDRPERPLHLLSLSAQNDQALRDLCQRYQKYLAAHLELEIADICFTANTGRTQFRHRLGVTASSGAELMEKLGSILIEQDQDTAWSRSLQQTTPEIVFIFTGQGSQYRGMGQELYETQPTFKQAVDRCIESLNPYLDVSLLEVIYGSEKNSDPSDLLDNTAYTQPALFILEYALAQLWMAWGIQPNYVMGHSVGEYVAACVAGVLSLEDGLRLITERARLMSVLPQTGSMVSAIASLSVVEEAIKPYGAEVSVAAINGPESIVFSGQKEAVQTIATQLEKQGIKTKLLQVSHAFHSPLMEPMLGEFEQFAHQIKYSAPQIPIISNLSGQIAGNEIARSDYWVKHVRQPVKFAQSMETLNQQGCQIFVEVGPKPILLGMGRQCLPETQQSWLPSLRPGQSDWHQMLESLSTLYMNGVTVDWLSFDRDYPQRKKIQDLPTYPFQRQQYWIKPRQPQFGISTHSAPTHPLLGQRLSLAKGSNAIYFQSSLSANTPSFLADHRIFGKVVMPGAAYVEMAIAAGTTLFRSNTLVIENIAFESPLILTGGELTALQMVLTPGDQHTYDFEIYSLQESPGNSEDRWAIHATGQIRSRVEETAPPTVDVKTWLTHRHSDINTGQFYERSREQGISFGLDFQSLRQGWVDAEHAYGQLQLPIDIRLTGAKDYYLHPILLDGGFQLAGAFHLTSEIGVGDALYLPVGIERLKIYRQGTPHVWVHAQARGSQSSSQGVLVRDLQWVDDSGAMIAEVEGFMARRATRESMLRSLEPDLSDLLYQVIWQAQNPPALQKEIGKGQWLVFLPQGELGTQLMGSLRDLGCSCTGVSVGETYEPLAADHYQINPLHPAEFSQLLTGFSNETLQGVIHLWSVEDGLSQESDLKALHRSQERSCASLLHLVQALGGDYPDLSVVFATKGAQAVEKSSQDIQPQQASVWGLGRVIAQEYPELSCRLLDLDPVGSPEANTQALMEELSHIPPLEDNQIAYRQGQRYVARLVRAHKIPQATNSLKVPETQAFQLKLSEYGSPDHLSLQPLQHRPPQPHEVKIQVQAVGLNFRDVLNSLGVLKDFYAEHLGISDPNQLTFGFEATGTVVDRGEQVSHLNIGDEVIAVLVPDAFSSFLTTRAEFVAKRPSSLTPEESATLPLVFLTAFYGLLQLAQLQPGERILIHAAAGGVGQAAVQLARQAGAEIFVTASPPKWDFLRSQGLSQIFNSRSLDFAEHIKDLTQGQGVDVVLNSLTGDYIPKSLDLLSTGGRFVEIGKAGIWSPEQVQQHRPDVSYYLFDLGEVGDRNPELIAQMLTHLLPQFEQGELQPLRYQKYPIEQVQAAFRLMQQGKHMGKVVITLPAVDQDKSPYSLATQEGSYLITGGLGILGLQMAQWLGEQGARSLVLMGRGTPSPEVQGVLSNLEARGITVVVAQGDVAEEADVRQILERIRRTLPPLRGIIHAAGVLDDGLLQQQSWERFVKVMAPKVSGSWNLHRLTEREQLDWFVCFSSIAAVLGSESQGNYAAANAFMDGLMHHRRHRGLPGLSINWGPWEAGMASRLGTTLQERLRSSGLSFLSTQEGGQVMGQVLREGATQVAVMIVDWNQFLLHQTQGVPKAFLEVFEEGIGAKQTQRPETSAFLEQWEATPPDQRQVLMMTHIRSQIAKTIGMSTPEHIQPRQALFDLGLDSLMAVELRNRLQKSLGKTLRSTLLFDYPNLEALTGHLIQHLSPSQTPDSPPPEMIDSTGTGPMDTVPSQVEQLSEEEAEALLMEKLGNLNI